ncbi:hypothetical protein GRI39_10585 [Altererythrobacter indicus]|uniref:Putative auto-transporter adhesin head GIN domain-containing protein n=1 Tax=Altericroceibacterium indicum TaxID=374177 RepID=A0A845ACJ5_9SPHN|nr:head GIN domain-containing protein [Altericroceibacterium indicum]MXP26485.1 hypothetical protein [Altericroceibacterium indicum]
MQLSNRNIFRALALGVIGATALSGCTFINQSNAMEGQTLSELDLTSQSFDKVTLAGPDVLEITSGTTPSLTAEGDEQAKKALRFRLEDGTLLIGRNDKDGAGRNAARIHLTMPPPAELALKGSGDITTQELGQTGKLSIAGSGSINAQSVQAQSLNASISGSGDLRAKGSTDQLKVSIAGSGNVYMSELTASTASVKISGSGDVAVRALDHADVSVAGSGDVDVYGTAECTQKVSGSGTVTCGKK